MSQAIFIYITVPSESEAQKIAEAVVADRLAACANIVPGMKSIYHWEGKLERGNEVILIFKTRAELFQAVEERVRELHSFATPCVVSLPLSNVSDGFMQWILAETKP
jgi:periplasmic divalent cation tolerance protein